MEDSLNINIKTEVTEAIPEPEFIDVSKVDNDNRIGFDLEIYHPPPNDSTASDDNSDDLIKKRCRYREVRDKNNEAIRRSRLKRKIRNQQMEKEVLELGQQNQRLKSQVTELEALITRMRNDLRDMKK